MPYNNQNILYKQSACAVNMFQTHHLTITITTQHKKHKIQKFIIATVPPVSIRFNMPVVNNDCTQVHDFV